MDTCVRNGIYDEALDLAAFISRLGLLHPNLPAVQLLQRQAGEVSAAMLEQLLQRLRGSIQVGGAGRLPARFTPAASLNSGRLASGKLAALNPCPLPPSPNPCSCPSACASSATSAAWPRSRRATCACSSCAAASSGEAQACACTSARRGSPRPPAQVLSDPDRPTPPCKVYEPRGRAGRRRQLRVRKGAHRRVPPPHV
jgi:hypothetical protein